MGEVKDAIILAGGMGTRMLPASLYSPKEALPLVDTPILNHLVWEAAKAGVKRIHLVLSKRKRVILDPFLESGSIHGQEIRGDLPRDYLSLGVDNVEIIPHIQTTPGGVADAISVAIGEISGPFLVLLGDMLLLDNHDPPLSSGTDVASNASLRLVESFEESGLPCVGIFRVGIEEVGNYGAVLINKEKIVQIIEKPEEGDEPSEYILCGRYIFPRETPELIERYPVSEYGELQSIKILESMIVNDGLGYVKLDEMKMYDSGNPISWLKSQIDHSLHREDLKGEMLDWLNNRLSK